MLHPVVEAVTARIAARSAARRARYLARLDEAAAREPRREVGCSNLAHALAAQTLAGAGQMVAAEAAPDLARMRAAVTSKGGTTAAALARLDALGLADTVAAAMQAAATRSHELAEQFGEQG